MVTKIKTEMLGSLRGSENIINYLNIPLVIQDISFQDGNYGEVALLKVQLPDKSEKLLRTGSKVILKQIRLLLEQKIPLPWLVKVIRIKRYITFAEVD